jgi:two-component system, NarL family, response regulator YdfI
MLFNTLRAAARGETLLSPEIISRLLSKVGEKQSLPQSTSLTGREMEVLQRVAKGERSKEIALHLGITERTVKAHLASIYDKLGVDSRAAAIAIAAREGLLPK